MGTEEVARVLGIRPVTVWRWCRDGSLPCIKIGRGWRIRRSALEEFLDNMEHAPTLTGQLRTFLRVPDNVMAVAQTPDFMLDLDAAFARVGEARGAMLVKYQREGDSLPALAEVREGLERAGVEVDLLEAEGRLRLMSDDGSEDRIELVRRHADEARRDGRSVWVNFNWDTGSDVEAALERQLELADVVEGSNLVVKTTLLEEDLGGWPVASQRQVQAAHSGTIWLSEAGLALGRVLPPPV